MPAARYREDLGIAFVKCNSKWTVCREARIIRVGLLAQGGFPQATVSNTAASILSAALWSGAVASMGEVLSARLSVCGTLWLAWRE